MTFLHVSNLRNLALLLSLVTCCSLAYASDSPTYSTLSIEQKKIWQRILLQEDADFRPSNSDYYLSNTATPDLAKEFDLVEQYLLGKLPFSGAPDATPWCRFPARFAFVAKAIYGNYFLPEAFRLCNLPLPELNYTLKADLVQTFELVDSGESLFHLDLLIHGTRFYNGSILTLNIGYSRTNDKPESNYHNPNAFDKALRLVKAFGGSGEVTVKTDNSPNNLKENTYGQQVYHINLPPEKIYLLVLMAFENKRAKLPYSLLRANCHSYLEHIFEAVLPELNRGKRIFFDFMPHFMTNTNEAYGQVFIPYRYWPSPRNQLHLMAKQLKWNEYASLQDFLLDGAIPKEKDLETSRPLRLAIGKAAEQNESALKNLPELIVLRDEYLSSDEHSGEEGGGAISVVYDESTVPVFNSSQPSRLNISPLYIDGQARLQFEMDVFNTMGNHLQANAPYGYTMGKLAIQSSDDGISFDHFLFAQEKNVGPFCCGETLYQLGVREISGISVDVVNNPGQLNLKAWQFKPELEINITKGIGTISNYGWSAQVLPNMSLLTYGENIDLNVYVNLGWTNGKWAVSASKLGRIYGPEQRRTTPDEMLLAEYKLSQDERFELTYKHFDRLGSIVGVGYAFAF